MSDAIERWMSDYGLEADTEGRVDQKMGSDDFDPPRGIYLFHIEAFEKQIRADERKRYIAELVQRLKGTDAKESAK